MVSTIDRLWVGHPNRGLLDYGTFIFQLDFSFQFRPSLMKSNEQAADVFSLSPAHIYVAGAVLTSQNE